jgi:EmrB/QacA subfamily drug resistance transporter
MNPPAVRSNTRNPAAVLALIVVSYLMIVIDISIVITGLPKIRESLGLSPVHLSWVHNAYTLTFGGLLLLGARAGDLFGRRRMFIAGLSLFTSASLVIGLAPSAAWLLAARAVQGAGAAVLAPSTLALLSTNFAQGPERTRALSLYAAAAGIGATAGLVLGGLFADLVSWRAGFFVNLPIGAALIVGARRYLVETPRVAGRLDLAGAVSSTLGMVALVFGIVHAAEQGWADAVTLASLASALVLIATFIGVEARAAHPILPLRLFADRQRSGAYAARLLFLGGMVGFWFFTTQYLQGVLGYRPLVAGLAFLPATLPNFASALMVPRLTRRWGTARLACAGLAMGAAGLAWLGQADAAASYWTAVAAPMVLIGIAQGLVLAPLTTAAVADVPGDQAGAASGMVNVAHQVGGSLGLAILIVVAAGADLAGLVGAAALSRHVDTAIDAGALMLLAATLVAAATLRPSRADSGAAPPARAASATPAPCACH